MIGYDDVVSGLSPENKLDEGAGDETSGAVPTASSDGIDTPDRQSGERERLNAALSPESLPADLIDRAARGLARGVWTSPFGGRLTPAEIARIVLIEVAPLLVEHGRQQAKTRWETRIEAEAKERDRLGNLPGAEEVYRLAEVHAAAVLRSLLTEEEALHAD